MTIGLRGRCTSSKEAQVRLNVYHAEARSELCRCESIVERAEPVTIRPILGPDQRSAELERVCSAKWVPEQQPLRMPADHIRGSDLVPSQCEVIQ
jgi:hypothetical protein